MSSTIPKGFHVLPLSVAQLSLAAVLKCGQSFRWTALPLLGAGDAEGTNFDVEYRLALKDRVVCLRQSQDSLFYRAVFPPGSTTTVSGLTETRDAETLAWLKDYFQLDVDLVSLYDTWEERDPVFAKLRTRFIGIRMLRQDPWENLVSFICSQNNHIPRITKMIQSLCTRFSPRLVSIPHPIPTSSSPESEHNEEPLAYHGFPSPAELAPPGTSTILRSLGFGYRAEYVQRTAQMLVEAHGDDSEDFLQRLRRAPTDEAREALLKFVGVGRKVADCVLLMSLDKRHVVPVDTHVHQIALKHYGFRGAKAAMTPKLYDEVQIKLHSIWGDHAGWAHTVLFTSDLKSFSTYGLLTPSPSVSPAKRHEEGDLETISSTTDAISSPVRPIKRKRVIGKVGTDNVTEVTLALTQMDQEGDLADRVKRRATKKGR